MRKIALLIGAIAMAVGAFAQSDIDAFRFSQTGFTGTTARSIGLGGAVGAVGADPSSILSNPAGMAQFKSSLFSITFDMNNLKNQGAYLNGDDLFSNQYKASMPNFNLIFVDRKMRKGQYAKSGWVNFNVGLGYNKVADYTRTISYEGINTNSSYLDMVSEYVQGLPASDLDANDEQLRDGFYYFENMFWYTYLIDTISDRNYMANYDVFNPDQFQSGKIRTSGSMHEWNLNLAANYEHKLFVGMGVQLDQVSYSEFNKFSEEDNPLTNGNWDLFEFGRHLQTSGYGLSGRLGVLFMANESLRIGGSIHSPKLLQLRDDYYDELYVLYDDGTTEDLSTIDKHFDYQVVTPMKYSLQATYIFNKTALITAEVESVDYSTMFISSDEDVFEDVNQSISNKYQNATNLKIGAEYAMGSFRIRAGLAQMGSAFRSDDSYSRRMAAFGFGLQDKGWAFDLSYAKTWQTDQYVPYQFNGDGDAVSSTLYGSNVAVTLTRKF